MSSVFLETPSDQVVLNMGPQHPSTHGVLRLIVKLEGETIVELKPDIGFLHRGTEKLSENRQYIQIVPYTDRMDYVAAMSNNLGYVLAVEKLEQIQVPERATYIRTILVELQRIASHLLWLGTFGMDVGATTVFLYCFRERERVLNLFEEYIGARLTYNAMRVGGLPRDLPPGWEVKVHAFLEYLPPRLDEIDQLLTGNRIFEIRTQGVGVLSQKDAVGYAASGPLARGSGLAFDLRRDQPYLIYDRLDWQVVTHDGGDCWGRYLVRLGEMRQSVGLVRQCLDKLPPGEVLDKTRAKYRPPKGEAFAHIEAPRGDYGCYIVSDGGPNPVRCRFRTPSFVNLQLLPLLSIGNKIADLVAILGSIDITLGDCDR